jgi:hypothetical protein
MATGKVKTLYSDEAKTEALFPRTKTSAVSDENGRSVDALFQEVDAKIEALTASDVGAVPTSRTVNGKVLSSNISLSAADVGARPSTWTPSAANVGAVPTSRKVNGKALSSDITLSASDVGARPDSWLPSAYQINAVHEFNHGGDVNNDEEFMTIIQNCVDALASDRVAHVSIMMHGRHSVIIHKHMYGYVDIEDISYQYSLGHGTYYYKRVRSCYSHQWHPWEYVNPPLAVGGEYRTTEKFGGKPVYQKLIHFGTIGTGETSVTNPVGRSGYVIECTGYAYNGREYRVVPSNVLTMYVDPDNIVIIPSHSGYAGWQAYLVLKYYIE